MTQLHKSQLRPKCRKILEKYREYNFILDDENYFTLSPESIKINYKSKYQEKKVWMQVHLWE
jgi:hypothetical protein